MANRFKKVEFELLTEIDMLLMVLIRGGICQSINRYAKANNKYIKEYDKKKRNCHI